MIQSHIAHVKGETTIAFNHERPEYLKGIIKNIPISIRLQYSDNFLPNLAQVRLQYICQNIRRIEEKKAANKPEEAILAQILIASMRRCQFSWRIEPMISGIDVAQMLANVAGNSHQSQ
jgi:hypothetical protein